MKVLMFGWEFPPHISGGLGTACYGLTKGLAENRNTDVIFVVPKAFGDEPQGEIQLIGANQVPVSKKEVSYDSPQEKMTWYEVNSRLIPYLNEEEFWELKRTQYKKGTHFVKTDEELKIDFTGGYGPGLMDEIHRYAKVAEIIARQNQFDIIHAHDWLAYPAGIAASRASGKPLVIHVHATDFDRSGGKVNPRVYALEREGMEMARHIIAVSGLTKKTIVEKYGIAPQKITVVYNAVDHPEKSAAQHKINKRKDEKIVTFLGRITLQKGPEYFIEAANLVLKNMKNVRFVMAGSGDLLNAMVERVAELGIADQFHFTGFLKGKEVTQMFRLTDVFVMPSVSEPFGIVPLEAMQSRVPVIISNQSGVSEIVTNAIKIDFWDTHAMADAIYGLLNYNALAKHFKKEGKSEVADLKWAHSAEEVSKIYRRIIRNHSK